MIDLAKLKKAVAKPPRILIHGGQGVGKTTFACGAPAPVVLDLEHGIPAHLSGEIPHFEPDNYDDIISFLNALVEQQHGFKTLIIDSLDVLEEFVTAYTLAVNGWPNIAQPGYGKGYTARTQNWGSLWLMLDLLRERGMCIILISHSAITKIEDPILPAFDSHGLHLYKTEGMKAVEWADVVGFALVKAYTTTTEGGRTMATTAGERVIYVHNNPAYIAKTRYNMPSEIPLDWGTFATYLKPSKPVAKIERKKDESEFENKKE